MCVWCFDQPCFSAQGVIMWEEAMQHNNKAAANNVTSFVNHFLDSLLSAYYAEAKLDVYRLLVLSDRKFKTQEYSVHCHKVQKPNKCSHLRGPKGLIFLHFCSRNFSNWTKMSKTLANSPATKMTSSWSNTYNVNKKYDLSSDFAVRTSVSKIVGLQKWVLGLDLNPFTPSSSSSPYDDVVVKVQRGLRK